MKLKSISLALAFLVSFAARAEYQIHDNGEVKTFAPMNVEALRSQTIDYSYRTVDFESWTGLEKKNLNLFDGFKVLSEKPTRMYIAKVSVLLDKNAGNVDVKQLLHLATLQSLESMVQLSEIDTKKEKVITLTDPSSAYRNPPAPYKWCDQGALCFKSNFIVQKPYNFAAAIVLGTNPFHVIEGQSELRVLNGNEIKNANDLKQLSGLNIEPSTLLVQNMFWANRLLRFGKVVGILQPVGNQTLVTAYMAFGIDRKLWDLSVDPLQNGHPVKAKDILFGTSPISEKDGILSGLPNFTKHLAKSLAEELNK